MNVQGQVLKYNFYSDRWPAFFVLAAVFIFFLSGCRAGTGYAEIPVPDRRMNLKGLEAVSIQYLDAHPEEFYAFSRILTDADNALGKHGHITRGAVVRWIRNRIRQEAYDETMPVYRLLKSVYLRDWDGSEFTFVDDDDREYLYDLIGAVMGGMHLCTTCSTARPMVRKGRTGRTSGT
ncbi:MAG: hypothetical protein HY283_05655 [Nitrospirae bacterium]|nr:hypothetical protein [Nitrospirota bacterium]